MIADLLIYLLKGSLALAMGYLFYRWVLRRHTHFQLNRWVLLLQMGLVFLLPVVQLPYAWHPLAQPLPFSDALVENAPKMTQEAPSPVGFATLAPDKRDAPFDLLAAAAILYGAGLLFFLARLSMQFFSLARLRQRAALIEKHPGYDLVWCKAQVAPFSFFKQIFLPQEGLDAEAVSQIVQHEQIHIDKKHSWDILLAEILIAAFWFNPFAWLYRRATEANLEFLTDQIVLKSGLPKKSYMYQLLAISLPEWKGRLSINYKQSLLQKRIAMMNTQVSSARSRWSYVVWLITRTRRKAAS